MGGYRRFLTLEIVYKPKSNKNKVGKNMINEVINDILQAEKQAEEIIQKAQEQSAEILARADNEALNILAKSKIEAKALRENIQRESTQRAESEYKKAIIESEEQVNNLKNQKSELIKSVSEQIFRSIVNGNC